MRLTRVLTALALMASTPALACGPDSDCRIGQRHYRIAMPEGHDGVTPVGAIVFAHGYRGSAKGTMRNKSLRRMASKMGLALVALKSAKEDWVIPFAPGHTDTDGAVEFNYVDAVLRDVDARFAIDGSRIMAAGFSAGGMMVWNLACAMPGRFVGFVPISGTFWRHPPETCQTPVASVVHFHGDADKIVPLKGREIGDTHQGDVLEALEMYRRFGRFGAEEQTVYDKFTCQRSVNDTGAVLQFCLFPGGHSFRTEYLRFAWDTFEEAERSAQRSRGGLRP